MAITRAGNLVTIVGFKLSSTATGGGTASGQSYLADTTQTGNVEENVTHSGTTNGDCKYTADGGERHSLEDTTKSFDHEVHVGFILENVTDSNFGTSYGTDLAGDNIRAAYDQFDPGETYRVHGFAKTAPTDWTEAYQWNLLWISGGTGAGQVRLIKCVTDVGGEARFWTTIPWETIPDATSQYRIFYSPMDVVYAFSAAGILHFDEWNLLPIWTEIRDELRWGDVSSTETGFGWSDLLMTLTSDNLSGASWDPVNEFYDNVHFFVGTFSPDKEQVGAPALLRGIKHFGYSGGFLGSIGSSVPDQRVFGSKAWGEYATFGSHIQEAYFSGHSGSLRSLNNGPFFACPQSVDSEADFVLWSGGNWGEPFAAFGGATANAHIEGLVGRANTATPAAGRGLGWLGGNSGSNGDFYTRMVDCDLGIVGVYKDGASRDIDWYQFDWYGAGFYYHIYVLKSLDFIVKDSVTGAAISGATIEVYDRLGNLISYEDSGATILESVDKTETVIDVSDDAPFAVDDVLLIDNEYMEVSAVTPGTPDTLTVTRKSRLPLYFDALLHEPSTEGYDPKIYIIQTLTSDAGGVVPIQKLFRSNVNWGGGPGTYQSEVTEGGTNYRCILAHTAAAGNKPPNVTYWTATGTQGLPWEVGKRYTEGSGITSDKSYADFTPWNVKCRKYGYHSFNVDFDIDHDSRGVAQPILLNPDDALTGISEAQAAVLPITYNAGTNTMVVSKDATWFHNDATACTPLHLYAKSQYEDWGVVHKHVQAEQYSLDCKVEIGDGVDAVYWKAENVQFTFADGIATADNDVILRVKTNSVMRWGFILDAGSKYTNKGCSLRFEESTYDIQVRADTNGTLNLYSTKYHQPSGVLRYSNDAWNCHFSGGMSVGVQAPDIDFFNLIIEGTGTTGPSGFQINGGLGDFNRISMLNVKYGLDLCQCFTNQAVMRHVYVRATDGGYLGGPDPTYFVDIVDSDFNTWVNPNQSAFAYGGTIRRIYTVRIKVQDQDENPLQNATVTLKDKNDSTVFSLTTDVNGDITDTEVVEGTLTYVADTPGDIVTLSPFTLRIEKAGFATYIEVFDMPINAIDGFQWVYSLELQRAYIDQEGGLSP